MELYCKLLGYQVGDVVEASYRCKEGLLREVFRLVRPLREEKGCVVWKIEDLGDEPCLDERTLIFHNDGTPTWCPF